MSDIAVSTVYPNYFVLHLSLQPSSLFSLFSKMLFFKTSPEYKRKRRDLTQSYDKNPFIHRKKQKQRDNTKKRHQKLRLHNECGRT